MVLFYFLYRTVPHEFPFLIPQCCDKFAYVCVAERSLIASRHEIFNLKSMQSKCDAFVRANSLKCADLVTWRWHLLHGFRKTVLLCRKKRRNYWIVCTLESWFRKWTLNEYGFVLRPPVIISFWFFLSHDPFYWKFSFHFFQSLFGKHLDISTVKGVGWSYRWILEL